MNNTFDIQRFGLLLKRKWLEFGKIYLIALAVVFGVILAAYAIAFWPIFTGLVPFYERQIFFRGPLFIGLGFLFLTAVASSFFAHLGQKPKTIIDLLIPASTFEKFFAGLFFTGIISTLSYLLIFFITDVVFVANLHDVAKDKLYFFSSIKHTLYTPVYIIPLFATSIFLLGSVYFDKFHYIKTALSIMVFIGIWMAVVFKSGELLTRGRHAVENNPIVHGGDKSPVECVLTILLVVLTIVFWAITYVRLKEKEV
jgi:hypothetical protein